MYAHLQFLRKQETIAKAYISNLMEASKRIDAEIKKADIAMAREMKRFRR